MICARPKLGCYCPVWCVISNGPVVHNKCILNTEECSK